MNFTAIDFETANLNRSSACSLGLVQVRDGIVTGEYEWLIDPQQPFNRMNMAIHELSSHKLNMISNHFGIRPNHHNALDDARACAQIMLKLMEQQKVCDPLLFAKSLGFQAGSLYSGGYTSFRKYKINQK
ncbi:hypothetical protein LBW89_25505 [Paenibacillus sp. alder61]|uniref:hypothetical protein n=1 Tax=Paenibacillus sp. alder61 TaxID=2862948 RepID=UPI001CD2390D|nr:hypothetical protein [Paenibacillus sp. alder61]MCA1296371.1 hypothetical protein [Paenibacillus sp. alder61]